MTRGKSANLRTLKYNWLVLIAAAVYGVAGLTLLFAGSELFVLAGGTPSPAAQWFSQLAAGAVLGLASFNWLQRFSVMGGILGRPLLLANLTFTTVCLFASLRLWMDAGGAVLFVAVAVFGFFTAGFGVRLFRRADTP